MGSTVAFLTSLPMAQHITPVRQTLTPRSGLAASAARHASACRARESRSCRRCASSSAAAIRPSAHAKEDSPSSPAESREARPTLLGLGLGLLGLGLGLG